MRHKLANKGQLALRLLISYILGLVIGNTILLPYTGALFIPFMFGGMVIALPLLAVALATLLLLENNIRANIRLWCWGTPLAIVAAWLSVEYLGDYSARGYSVSDYLMLRNVLERSALALLCASVSSSTFFIMMTKPRPEKHPHKT